MKRRIIYSSFINPITNPPKAGGTSRYNPSGLYAPPSSNSALKGLRSLSSEFPERLEGVKMNNSKVQLTFDGTQYEFDTPEQGIVFVNSKLFK